MNLFFAMAGLAEVALYYGLLVCWAGLYVIGVLMLLCWIRRSWRFGIAAIVTGIALGYLLGPFNSLFPSQEPPEVLKDPDYIYWLTRYRTIGVSFLIAIASSTALVFLGRRFPRVNSANLQSIEQN